MRRIPAIDEADYLKMIEASHIALDPQRPVSRWHEMTPDDFGDVDYSTFEKGTNTIFWPESEAATQWFYARLPEGIDRWGRGHVVETRWASLISLAAKRDGLMSEDEFKENEQTQRQR